MSVAPQGITAEYDAIGLVSIASMTNNELFTKVIAAIKRSFKQKKSDIKDWQSVATQAQVASCAAKGHAGYRSPDDWVKQFHTLVGGNDNGDQRGAASARSSLGDALKALPAKDCYRTRLENAFAALKSSASTPSSDNDPKLTVKQAAGLIRSAAFLSAEFDDNDKDSATAKIDCELQSSAISHLVEAMPQLATSSPCDIFLAVQLPLLQKIQWEAFGMGGINFASADAEAEFKSLLNLDFGKQHDSSMQVGEKRKRVEEGIDDSIKNANSTVLHLLEAANLSRNGNVRAQHGAVIYNKTTSKVIGRGWNHDLLVERAKFNKNKLVLHSEAHAVADAIRTHGEDACFGELFPNATIMIVELESDYTYDTAHPCPKCDPLLRAVGVTNVQHTTPDGSVAELKLSPPSLDFLTNENVAIPLEAACDEQKICCKRLQEAFDMKKYSK